MRVAGVMTRRLPSSALPSTVGHARTRCPRPEPPLDPPVEPGPNGAEPPRTCRPSERGLTPFGESSVTESRTNPASTLARMAVTGSPELLIVMSAHATGEQVDDVVARLEEAGAHAHVTPGREATVIGAIGERELLAALPLEGFPGVDQVLPILKPYKLVSRELRPDPTVIDARGRRVGDGYFGLIAGPCTVETREQTFETARAVAASGASMLRGGAFKPRTSPYTFQGLGQEALTSLAEAREETGLPLVTELMDPRHVEAGVVTDRLVQIGARNMSNFALLAEVGRARKPVLLKRGLSSTVEDLLMAAEYIVKEGNSEVILCERGIKTFETATRFTLD